MHKFTATPTKYAVRRRDAARLALPAPLAPPRKLDRRPGLRHGCRSRQCRLNSGVRRQAISLLLTRLRGEVPARREKYLDASYKPAGMQRRMVQIGAARKPEQTRRRQSAAARRKQVKDPVCGMSVDPAKAAIAYTTARPITSAAGHAGRSSKPIQRSILHGQPRLAPPRQLAQLRGRGVLAAYVCPMDPEVRQDHPGACPKCGMALEPELPSRHEDAVDLPDASRDRARRAGRVSHLRHGAGAAEP